MFKQELITINKHTIDRFKIVADKDYEQNI